MADPSAPFYILISSVSCIAFIVIFHLSPWISNCMSSSYKQFPIEKQVDWNTRIGSNIHAVVATTMSVYAFLFDEEISNDHFCTDAVFVRSGISVTFGYILADLVIILWYYQHIGEIFTIVHHIMALWAYMYVVGFGYVLFFANVRQIAELSTPFVNQRWFYDAVGHPRNSRCFITNGLLLILTFFLARIMFIPYFYYKTYSVWFYPQRIALGPIVSSYWIITASALDIINLYWFKKIVRGGVKLLMPDNKNEKVE